MHQKRVGKTTFVNLFFKKDLEDSCTGKSNAPLTIKSKPILGVANRLIDERTVPLIPIPGMGACTEIISKHAKILTASKYFILTLCIVDKPFLLPPHCHSDEFGDSL